MTLLTPGFLAIASLEVHQTAEQHWRSYGTSPIKVVLFAADGVPELVDFPQGIGQDAAGEAVRAHAARIGAVAVVLTAIAHVAEVEIGLTPSEPGTAQPPDQSVPSAWMVGDFGRAVVTLTLWPERELTKALKSSIITGLAGPAVLLASREGTPADPAELAGLITWLSGLLPARMPKGTR
jgi:hypothetical protein